MTVLSSNNMARIAPNSEEDTDVVGVVEPEALAPVPEPVPEPVVTIAEPTEPAAAEQPAPPAPPPPEAQVIPLRMKAPAPTVGIDVRDLWLSYPINGAGRASLKSSLLGLMGHREARAPVEYIDALRGVSFSIGEGERVGIIGRNGSGKSTLLRTLAGAFPTSRGRIAIGGEIGTLLDIALGFEVESTGRENIYNRGLAMGYSPKQIRQVEREIVAFADLGQFIDLPMRTYSTGMYVRLGFAVSTQFVPDVLLIDEVFSAGDAVFAQRAMDRLNQIVSGAGIVVIVSHDLVSVRQICDRVIWLHRGEIRMDGPAADVIDAFSNFAHSEV